jgi:nitronate monooxygenase
MNTRPLQPARGHAAPTPADAAGPVMHDELLAALNELLEAERAGARVAMETGREIASPDLAALVRDIHQDEVRWCGMLMRTIQAMGATPSSATGAFWGKAMAIADVDERLVFLNRGQAWVVRRLQALLPRIADAAVRAELETMLEAHRHNIGRVEAQYPDDGAATAGKAT